MLVAVPARAIFATLLQLAFRPAHTRIMGGGDDDMFGDSDDDGGGSEHSAAKTIKSSKSKRSGGRGRSEQRGKAAKKDNQKTEKKASGARAKKTQKEPCFVCSKPRVGSQKWCAKHRKDYEAMEYQATRDKKLKLFQHSMSVVSQARVALQDFDDQNPEGKFRKSLIDWGHFKRKFAKTNSSTLRRSEVEWTYAEYYDEWIGRRNETDIKMKWKDMLQSDLEREGDGYDAVIWIPEKRKRMRDVTTSVSHAFEEGSKVTKNLADKEKQHLKDFIKKGNQSFRTDFFDASPGKPKAAKKREGGDGDSGSSTGHDGGSSESETEKEGDTGATRGKEGEAPKKGGGRKIDLAIAVPELVSKSNEMWEDFARDTNVAISEAKAVLEQAESYEPKQSQKKAFDSWLESANQRVACASAWADMSKSDDAPLHDAPVAPAAGGEAAAKKLEGAAGAAEAEAQEAQAAQRAEDDEEDEEALEGGQGDGGDEVEAEAAAAQPKLKRVRAKVSPAAAAQAAAATTGAAAGSQAGSGDEPKHDKDDAQGAQSATVIVNSSADTGATGAGAANVALELQEAIGVAEARANEIGADAAALGALAAMEAAGDRSLGERRTADLLSRVKLEGRKTTVNDLTKLRSLREVHEMIAKLDKIEDPQEFDTNKKFLAQVKASVSQLRYGMTKAVGKLSSHMNNAAKKEEKTQQKESALAEKKAVASAKAFAKAATEKVFRPEQMPLFEIVNFETLLTEGLVGNVTHHTAVDQCTSVDAPWLLKAEAPCIHKWKSEQKPQISMSTYATQYKAQTATKESGRGQCPLNLKEGKEETDVMMNQVLSGISASIADIKDLPAGSVITNVTWAFGCIPGWAQAAWTPYGLGMVKLLSMGKIRWLLFDIGPLSKALTTLGKDVNNIDKMMEDLLKLTDVTLRGLIGAMADSKPEYIIQHAYEVLYVPAGWIACELPEGSLVYGVRKCVPAATKLSANRYKQLLDLYKVSGKATTKMEQVAARLSQVAEKPAAAA